MPLQHFLVWHIVRYFAQAIHIVGKCNKPCLHLVIGQDTERVAHHGRTRYFPERSDMRQTRWTIAGLKYDFVLRKFFQSRDNLARLFEWPGIRLLGQLTQGSGVFRHRDRVSGARTLEMPRARVKWAFRMVRPGNSVATVR